MGIMLYVHVDTFKAIIAKPVTLNANVLYVCELLYGASVVVCAKRVSLLHICRAKMEIYAHRSGVGDPNAGMHLSAL